MSLPTYPGYKDSGVDWLGTVPEHWDSKRLKFLFDLVKREIREEDRIVTCFRDGAVTLRDNRRTDGFTNAVKEIGYQGIRVGDLVIHAMDAFAGAIGVSDSDGKSTPVYSVCTPVSPSVSSNYYARLLRNMAVAGFVSSLAKGIRERSTDFRWADAGEIFLPVPSETEQRKIVSFLDHETARIDALIEEQQRLIELLKEKRQAMISLAVTKGLDPTVPMKDSGVEWLGEVPAHWESLTLGRIASSVKTGGTPSDDLPSADIIDGVEWYTPGDFTGDLLLDSSEKRVSAGAVRSGDAKVFPSGSVLIVSIGATLGKVGHIRRPASANQQINAVVPGPRVDGYFLAYSLSVKVNAMRFLSNASTIGIMNQEKTKEIWLSLPPLQEQKLITEFLDKQTSVIDTLIQEAAGGVALLQERRSALISAAVTGKIDVRGWQPPASTPAPKLEVAEAV
jgi:type I restriction enzyme, S subunit